MEYFGFILIAAIGLIAITRATKHYPLKSSDIKFITIIGIFIVLMFLWGYLCLRFEFS